MLYNQSKKKRGIRMIFKWMNESEIRIEGDRIEIAAPPKTDFFCGSIFMNIFLLNIKLLKIFGTENKK